MPARERGMVLPEVLAALVIVSVVGLSALQLVGGWSAAVASAAVREREQADAERLLAAHTLLARVDLDRRLGARETGPYRVTVLRPERGLYRIAVAMRTAPDVELLVTVVFRPEAPRAS